MKLLNKLQSYCILVFIIFTLIISSCKRNIDVVNNSNNKPDLSTKVTAALISGFVSDENDDPLPLAQVKIGSEVTTTDKYGYFQVKNVEVVKDVATVTITKPNYFKTVKTFIAATGKSSFTRIKLLPKTLAGTFDAGIGGTVSLSNGLSISIPANAIVTLSNNVPYQGNVNVKAQLISAADPDLNSKMPGDLRGLNENNNLRLLVTYGMAAVELTGSGNELLQIAPGKKAILTLPIPASLMTTAPGTIPLWYFDENIGLWKEEGSATRLHSNYIGEVSHFSFWNCDIPQTYIQFNCTVKDGAGNPIPYAYIKISEVNNPANAGSGYTDANGYVGGLVPDNAQLLLKIFASSSCTTPIYTQTFTTTNINISLGTIGLNGVANVTGTATNCNNSPVTNGYIIFLNENQLFRYPMGSGGNFNFSKLLCNSPANGLLIAEDDNTLQQSVSMNIALVTGANFVGNLQACGISSEAFIYYTIDGRGYLYASPIDSISYQGGHTPEGWISSRKFGSVDTMVAIQFSPIGIGLNTVQSFMALFAPPELTRSSQIAGNYFNINITEYGPPGQFVSGNFSGLLQSHDSPYIIHTVTCSFRVRRP